MENNTRYFLVFMVIALIFFINMPRTEKETTEVVESEENETQQQYIIVDFEGNPISDQSLANMTSNTTAE